ncbi:MAG TPA: glycosyltransferase family 4 protein, partial [Chitinophagaceae bacterium]|nr:glycosyltransferase family 4 protein [Chitinophagaceae bacterium]
LFKIIICGRLKEKAFRYLETFRHPNVIFAGEVPDIDPYFLQADVFLNPVLFNSGVQTKIMDALRLHCNVVAFQESVDDAMKKLVPEKLFTVANSDWQAFAGSTWKACEIKAKTPASFFSYYDWNNLAEMVWRRLKLFQNPITAR